jgi:GNAT superfamily N-acetyltransferase
LVHAMSDGSPAQLQWRPMVAVDLPAVDRLAARIHPDYPERPEVLAEKFRLFPRGCFVLDRGPEIHGYCFSHPWTAGPPPALDTAIGALPDTPDAYFIHDIALDQPARGMALASLLVPMLTDTARGVGIGRRQRAVLDTDGILQDGGCESAGGGACALWRGRGADGAGDLTRSRPRKRGPRIKKGLGSRLRGNERKNCYSANCAVRWSGAASMSAQNTLYLVFGT